MMLIRHATEIVDFTAEDGSHVNVDSFQGRHAVVQGFGRCDGHLAGIKLGVGDQAKVVEEDRGV